MIPQADVWKEPKTFLFFSYFMAERPVAFKNTLNLAYIWGQCKKKKNFSLELYDIVLCDPKI